MQTQIKPNNTISFQFRELYKFRSLFLFLTKRDFSVRYRQTRFGLLWVLVQPVLSLTILYFVFGRIANLENKGYNYILFLQPGILLWQYFYNLSGDAAVSLLNADFLIKKVYFPRIIIPLSKSALFIVDIVVNLIILWSLFIFFKPTFNLSYEIAFAYLFLFIFFNMGCALLLSSVVAFIRDVKFIIPFALQILFFATPIGYSVDNVPDKWQWLVWVNPLSWFIEGFRNSLLGGEFTPNSLIITLGITFVSLIVGFLAFNYFDKKIIDTL